MTPEQLHALEVRRVAAREAHTLARRRYREAGRSLGLAKDALKKAEPPREVPLPVANQFARSLGGVVTPQPVVDPPDLTPQTRALSQERAVVANAQRERDDAQAELDAAQAELDEVEALYSEATKEPTLQEANARMRTINEGIQDQEWAARRRLLDALDAAEEVAK
jgi:hypothetical protein